ncbi:hypothetical protein FBU30_001719 [Linnemannia zychae]|nr:hypothetical protein FBU30_001719 [Linnemannia zychae]
MDFQQSATFFKPLRSSGDVKEWLCGSSEGWPTQICMTLTGAAGATILTHLYKNDYTSPAAVFGYTAFLAAWLLAVPLNYYEHEYSIRSSDMLFSFYILSITALAIQARTVYLLSATSQGVSFQLGATLFMLMALLTGFIVEAWPRGTTKVQASSSAPIYDKANLFSQMTYFFYLSIIRMGNTKPLLIKDIGNQLQECIYTTKSQPQLDHYWEANKENARKNGRTPSLFRAVLQSQLLYVPALLLLRILRVFTNFSIPVIFNLLLAYFQDIQKDSLGTLPTRNSNNSIEIDDPNDNSGGTSLAYGLYLAVAMLFMGLANSILLTVNRQYCIVRGLEIRSALLGMIYRKSLKLSPDARQASTIGSVTSYMSVDADHWLEGGIFLTTWIAVWRARIFRKLQRQKNGFIDERIRLTTEILSAIKIVKLYAWENAFLKRILDVRNLELGVLRHVGTLYAVMSIVFNSLTLIIRLVTLSVYAKWGGPNFSPGGLTPQIVFVSMTLFALLRVPIVNLTETITSTVTLTVSSSRIQAFLLQEENDLSAIIREDLSDSNSEGMSMVIKDATFSWTKNIGQLNRDSFRNEVDVNENDPLLYKSQDSEITETQRPTLQHITLSIKNGSLVAIVGRVGQGKSSLLSALIGDMYKVQGYAKTVGRIAYPDLAILPAGDQTEIGERGVNLSGEQKQRIALARAAYYNADIYLLDDPLSAVDAHVDQHLWNELIGPQGLLCSKVRLLVTYGIHHLKDVDQTVLMKDGCVTETGHYEDLMASGQTFCQLIKEYGVAYHCQDGSGSFSTIELENIKSKSHNVVKSGIENARVAGRKHEEPTTEHIKENTKKDKEAGLLQAENVSVSKSNVVNLLSYLRAITFKYAVSILLLQVLMQICYVGTSLWLKYWIGQNEDANHNESQPSITVFLFVFSSLTLVYVLIGTILFWITFGVARIHASECLYRKFMDIVMRLPSAFFDTTPKGMDLVLKGISFTVEDGQKIGIVGRTGAGKSSLTLAHFRMIEVASNDMESDDAKKLDDKVQLDGGKIMIDNVDISTVGLADLRKNLSIIPQEPVLFAGTVRENLDPFGELDDTVLWEALRYSHLESIIASLPGGLMSKVAQNSENFSVGQRSLICRACALLRKSKILVMDEATSSVDIETDELTQKTIQEKFKERMILTIAHRIKTVMDSDKILVLEQGRVVEFDSPKTLLKDEQSLFYRLAKQAGEV